MAWETIDKNFTVHGWQLLQISRCHAGMVERKRLLRDTRGSDKLRVSQMLG